MSLIEQKEGWIPNKIHGEVELPDGADIETTVSAALKRLMHSSQIPVYTDILYQIKTHIITADIDGVLDAQVRVNKSLVFELD